MSRMYLGVVENRSDSLEGALAWLLQYHEASADGLQWAYYHPQGANRVRWDDPPRSAVVGSAWILEPASSGNLSQVANGQPAREVLDFSERGEQARQVLSVDGIDLPAGGANKVYVCLGLDEWVG